MTRRRILHVLTRMNIGGPARHVLAVATALGGAFDIEVAAGGSPTGEGELTDPAVAVRHVPLVRPVRPLQDARALASLRALLEAQRPAVLHTHMAKAGAIGRVAARTLRSRPRTVHTFHGHVLEGYFSPAMERILVSVERRLAARTDRLVAVSSEIREQLLAFGIGEPEQYVVIPPASDVAPFLATARGEGKLRQAIGVADGTPVVGVVGRLAPVKDHAVLLRALHRLPDVHLVVLGDGELRDDLQRLSDELGLSRRAHFVGWWHHMPDALSDIDVVALTSRNEGCPVALIEAAAAGCPVVATDVGGVRSVVADAVTGTVVPPGDPAAVAEALDALLGDRHRRLAMGEAAREHARRSFDPGAAMRALRALYEDLLA